MNKQEYTYNSPSVQKMLQTIARYMAYSAWKEKYEIVIEREMDDIKKKKEQKNVNKD